MPKSIISKLEKNSVATVIIIVLILASVGFDGFQFYTLRQNNISLQNNAAEMNDNLTAMSAYLSKERFNNKNLTEALQNEHAQNNFFQGQIEQISSSVGILEKITSTDAELLKKYSKVYFLNENYAPKALITIDPKYTYQGKSMQFLTQAYPYLQRLMDAASADGLNLEVISAFRSFGTQAILKSSYKVTYGAGTANSFSADQGYSEHQLGTTVDFTTLKVGATFSGFDKTPEYTWLLNNAYKYGFEMSYPKENTYYIFEPWHFRFVGVTLATRLHDQNVYFYSLNQRDIDQYLVNLFD